MTPDNIVNTIAKGHLFFFWILACSDFILTFYALKFSLELKNIYFRVQKRFGILLSSAVKLVLIIILSKIFMDPLLSKTKIIVIVFVYALLVVRLLMDVLKEKKMGITNVGR